MLEQDCSMYAYLTRQRASLPDCARVWKFFGRVGTQRELDKHTAAFGAYLQSIGVGVGDNVILCLGNIPNAIVAFYAINRIGAVANLLHPLMPAPKITQIIRDMHPKAVILFDEFYKDYHTEATQWQVPVIYCAAADYLPVWMRPFYRAYVHATCLRIPYDGHKVLRYRDVLRHNLQLQAVSVRGQDLAVYMHSSGTTGSSKTVMVDNLALNHVAHNVMIGAIGTTATNDDCMLMVLPIFHTFGLGVCMHTSLCAKGYPVLMPRFRAAAACRMVRRNHITFISGVPNMYDKMLRSGLFRGKYLRRLRACYCGGDKVSATLRQRFRDAMREQGVDLPLSEGYGLTEAGITCINTPQIYREGSLGKPIVGSRFCIVDESFRPLPAGERGMLLIDSNMLMRGYWNEDPSLGFHVDEQGTRWLVTGDVGYLDEDGYFYFTDREKRMIKISGVNVFPQEIENVVEQLSCIRKCCAVRTKAEGKNTIHLYIVLSENVCYNDSVEREIRSHIARHLMKYSQPARIIPIDALPLTQIGKVDYRAAEAMAEGK